jgi:hypothetical protein
MRIILIALMLTSASVWSEESKLSSSSSKKETSVENIVKAEKKERRKKVEMCHDCGKPESECDCKGEGHDEKKKVD